MNNYIELKNLSQSFNANDEKITLFEALNMTIQQGTSYAVTGPSGAGKSSLLMLASGLENPSCGEVNYIEGNKRFSLDAIRDQIGFIFQQFHLLPELTALNNVALPLKLRGDKQAITKAANWLEKVGLAHRKHHKPSQLSGGEQQRVAIARALVFEPKFIFADEPTGNLDPKSAQEVATHLVNCCKENNASLIIVTHSLELAGYAEHVYHLANGTLSKVSSEEQEAVACY